MTTTDKYGNRWPDNYDVCPECGQPDNCGDCNHGQLTAEQVVYLGGRHAGTDERLEYLRGELRAERLSWGEVLELQSLAPLIDRSDVELLEAAGVPEYDPDGKHFSDPERVIEA